MQIVIPSVRYAEELAVILPAWQRTCPEARIRVVTAPDDPAIDVAAACGVDCVVTDAWTRQAPVQNGDRVTFNKARALDEAWGFPDRPIVADGDLCLSLDCDVYPMGRFPVPAHIRSGVIYGCARYRCLSQAELDAHVSGELPLARLPLIGPRVKGGVYGGATTPEEAARKCLGYFQLFRYRPGLRFGSYRSASTYDKEFRRQFDGIGAITDFYVLHLGEPDQRNWSGRVVPAWESIAC